MTFWIEDYKDPVPGNRKLYVLHYGHGESSLSIVVDGYALSQLKSVLGGVLMPCKCGHSATEHILKATYKTMKKNHLTLRQVIDITKEGIEFLETFMVESENH